MSDEPREERDEERGPRPATWAGRRRSEAEGEATEPTPRNGEPEEVQGEAGAEGAEPESGSSPADGAESNGAQETVEADTLALADAEAAREAALAGLRARTEERAAKLQAGAPAKPPEAPQTVAAPAPAPPAPPATIPLAPAEDEKPSRRLLWPRFVAASFLIVASMATATAVSLLVYLTDIAKGLGGLEVRGLTAVESGEPQNFLILGSDKRSNTPGDPGRSDTTILLRVNADEDVITMMSIPRDLEVNIPGHGVDKFNAAYSYGGPQLTLKTVQQLTQDRIPVNHIVNIDFLGFADAVNAIGCVYIDVDRHYYIPPNSGVAEIDIQAGYQRLCGLKALQYVRYRHTDNDIVRSARQQDFLREARAAVPTSKLLNDSNDLIDIFTKYTESDIKKPTTLISLLKLLISARGAPVQEIQFPTTSLDRNGYVTSNNDLVQRAVSKFLDPVPEEPETAPSSGGGSGEHGGGKPSKPPEPAPPPLIDSTASAQQYAALFRTTQKQDGSPMLDPSFPIYYPTRLAPASGIDDESRAFVIDGPGDEVYHGYRFVATVPGSFGTTGYYGVSGTDWKDPPILANASEEREIDGRTYKLYYDGDRLRLVAFQTDRGSYWVINTLTQQLGEGQMLGIAESLREYTG